MNHHFKCEESTTKNENIESRIGIFSKNYCKLLKMF